LFEPASGKGPGVLVLHAWWGLNQDVLDFAAHLANEGFTAFAPDMFDGSTPATTIEGAEKLAGTFEGERGVEVEQAALGAADWLIAHTGGPIGAVGFSFGAGYCLWLGVKRPESINAIAVYYGSYPGVGGTAPVLGHYAEEDPYEAAEQVTEFDGGLREQGRDYALHHYPGTYHWFAEPGRPQYQPEAADLAWQRTVDFLRKHAAR
jgi:carboxymethylenebutenolidase